MDNSTRLPIVVFCVVVMAFQFLFNGGFSSDESLLSWILNALLGIVVASVAAAVTFVATGGTKK